MRYITVLLIPAIIIMVLMGVAAHMVARHIGMWDRVMIFLQDLLYQG